MNLRIATLTTAAVLGAAFLGVDAPANAADIVIVEDQAPTFVEEGVVLNGAVVIAPKDVNDYVFINGGWYYYHPALHTWVHVVHEKDWHPARNGHIYHRWSEHPMYHRK